MTPSGAPALTALERARLADAIRGRLDRFPVGGREFYARLTAGGVSHEAALLLVAAFARDGDEALSDRGRRDFQPRLFTEGGESDA